MGIYASAEEVQEKSFYFERQLIIDALQYSEWTNQELLPDFEDNLSPCCLKNSRKYGDHLCPFIKVYFIIFNSFIVYFCAHDEIFLYLAKVVRHLRDAILVLCLLDVVAS